MTLPLPSVKLVEDSALANQRWYDWFDEVERARRVPVTTAATTVDGLIGNSGITILTTPSTQTLALPSPGVRKVLVVTPASTTTKVVSASTAVNIRPGTGWRLNFTSSGTYKRIELVGMSTSEWLILSNPDAVTVTT